jgi:hypothetical protein
MSLDYGHTGINIVFRSDLRDRRLSLSSISERRKCFLKNKYPDVNLYVTFMYFLDLSSFGT